MPNTQFHRAISEARFSRYFIACKNNQRRAERLYRANLRLSQKMYAVLGIFEIILRNSMDRHLSTVKGNCWLEDAVMPGGYLEVSPGCEKAFHSVHDAIHRLGAKYTHDKLIAELTFGFWAYQFSKKEFAASGSTLLQIFPNRPHGTKPKDIFQNLVRINDTRNRIAHYEPICFDKASFKISSAPIQRRYNLILQMLTWLGCNPKRILYGIDSVQSAINTIALISQQMQF